MSDQEGDDLSRGSGCSLLQGPAAWSAQGGLAVLVVAALYYKRCASAPRNVPSSACPRTATQGIRLLPLGVQAVRLCSAVTVWGTLSMLRSSIGLSCIQPCASTCRHREDPPRPFIVWLLDISKQAISGVAAHFLSIAIAIVLKAVATRNQGTSECSWYFIIFAVGSSLGTLLTLWAHAIILKLAQQVAVAQRAQGTPQGDSHPTLLGVSHKVALDGSAWADLAACGEYGSPPNMRRWLVQVRSSSHCAEFSNSCSNSQCCNCSQFLARKRVRLGHCGVCQACLQRVRALCYLMLITTPLLRCTSSMR